jgi:hypothetical protein
MHTSFQVFVIIRGNAIAAIVSFYKQLRRPLCSQCSKSIASAHCITAVSLSLCVFVCLCCVLCALCCVLCAVCCVLCAVCCVYGTYSTVRFGTRTHLLQRLCHHFTPRCAFCSDRSDNRSDNRSDRDFDLFDFSTFRLFVHRVNFHFFPTLFSSLSFLFAI